MQYADLGQWRADLQHARQNKRQTSSMKGRKNRRQTKRQTFRMKGRPEGQLGLEALWEDVAAVEPALLSPACHILVKL